MSRFSFTGTIGVTSTEEKPWVREGTTKSGKPYLSLRFNVAEAKNNRGFVEFFGMERDEINVVDTDGNKLSVDWDERDDKNILKKVTSYRKYVAQLEGKDRVEFLSDYDFARYIAQNIDDIKGKVYQVTGNVKKEYYNGKILEKFQMQSIYFKKAGDEPVKKNLKITSVFFWGRDGIDLADWKKEKKITVSGYTQENMPTGKTAKGKAAYKNYYVPQTIVFDCSRVDFENEDAVAQAVIRLENIGIDYNDGELKVRSKKNTYYSNEIEIHYVNGAEEVEITMDMLTEMQRKSVKAGLKTLDDFRNLGSVFGDRVSMWKYVNVTLKGKYDSGVIELEDSSDDFEEDIYLTEDDDDDEVPFEMDDEDKKSSKKKDPLKGKMNPPKTDEDDMIFEDDEEPKKSKVNTSKTKPVKDPDEDLDDDDMFA